MRAIYSHVDDAGLEIFGTLDFGCHLIKDKHNEIGIELKQIQKEYPEGYKVCTLVGDYWIWPKF
jgi:hypothetical protein